MWKRFLENFIGFVRDVMAYGFNDDKSKAVIKTKTIKPNSIGGTSNKDITDGSAVSTPIDFNISDKSDINILIGVLGIKTTKNGMDFPKNISLNGFYCAPDLSSMILQLGNYSGSAENLSCDEIEITIAYV